MMICPRMGRIIAAALVAAALPLAASADTCPTGADLAGGIALSMADGNFTMSTRSVTDGIEVTSSSRLSDGSPFHSVATFAHPLALPLETPGAAPVQIVYENAVAGLNALPSTREWSSTFEFRNADDVIDLGSQTSRLTGLGQLNIGSCSYEVWRVNRTVVFSDGLGLYSEHVFAPDLGIIVGETTLDENGNPRAVVFFDEITAE